MISAEVYSDVVMRFQREKRAREAAEERLELERGCRRTQEIRAEKAEAKLREAEAKLEHLDKLLEQHGIVF